MVSRKASELNDLHSGETIFIVGAGPQLAHLVSDELRRLETRTTIGLNRATYLLCAKFFLSAYIGQVLLARMSSPTTTLLHMRPKQEPPLEPGIIAVRRDLYRPGIKLHKTFDEKDPVLFTLRNAALGATHLALILGARRIAYVGVEQRNRVHFYHYRKDVQERILADTKKLHDYRYLDVDHPYATHERLISKLRTSRQEEEGKAFYEESHAPAFRRYFELLSDLGIETVSTLKDSVVSDAGAAYIPLDELLDQQD